MTVFFSKNQTMSVKSYSENIDSICATFPAGVFTGKPGRQLFQIQDACTNN
jgi:hypothetical protein